MEKKHVEQIYHENSSTFYGDKSKLMNIVNSKGTDMYNHLKVCIKTMLLEQRDVNYDQFEKISETLKNESKKFSMHSEASENPALLSTAKIKRKLFIKSEEDDEEPVIEENTEHPLPNIMEYLFHFEKAGIGLARLETVQLNLAIKSLVNTQPVKTAKFWGKIFGILQNYYIVETQFAEGEDPEEDAEEVSNGDQDADNETEEDVQDDGKEALPKSKWKPVIKIQPEPNHTGTNKMVYFVCHEPGLRWIRLPQVTPEQITTARSIRRMFTGILDSPVKSYPPFPGTEANYLRAQIARISAGTQISPAGYFIFGGDEEEEIADEEGGDSNQRYSKNEDYEPPPLKDLTNPNLTNWVHHTPYILPQGRVQWWNPTKSTADEFDEFGEEEEEEEENRQKSSDQRPETGPPILTSISADLSLFGQSPWTVRMTSQILPEFASAVVSSNLWVGAHAIAWEKHFNTVYIGWGLKSSGPGFHPQLPPVPFSEYEQGLELNETSDPTPEEEAALRTVENINDPENVEDEALNDPDDEGEED